MASKAQREAQDSQVNQLRQKGKGIKEIMGLTNQSYARVKATLDLANGNASDDD